MASPRNFWDYRVSTLPFAYSSVIKRKCVLPQLKVVETMVRVSATCTDVSSEQARSIETTVFVSPCTLGDRLAWRRESRREGQEAQESLVYFGVNEVGR